MAITNINNNDKNQISGSGVVSTNTSPASSNADNTSILTTKKPKEELLKKLGITAEQYLEICNSDPSFETLPFEKQLEFISKSNSQKATDNSNNASVAETSNPSDNQNVSEQYTDYSDTTDTTGLFFDKASFAKKSENKDDANRKINTYIQEYAKNTFRFSVKNSPKTEEDWNALSDEEKAEYINNATNVLKDKFGEVLKGSSLSHFDIAIDGMMTDLLAANSTYMRIDDFYSSDKILRKEAVYSYLREVVLLDCSDSLSEQDKMRFAQEKLLTDSVGELLGQENICPDTAYSYMRDNNLTEYEIEFDYLDNKISKGDKLSQFEEAKWKELNDLKKSSTFTQVVTVAKVQGLNKLKEERAEALQNGNQSKVEKLDKVINSPESKAIEEWSKSRNEAPVETTKEYEDFKKSSFGKLYTNYSSANSSERAAIIFAYLEEKVPPEKRAEVFAKMVQGVQSEGPESLDLHIKLLEIGLQNKEYADAIADTANLTTLNVANNNNVKAKKQTVHSAQRKIRKRTIDVYNNAKTKEAKDAQRKIITESISVQRTHGTDESKSDAINDYAELSSDDEIGVELIEANISITDKKIQRTNIPKINKNASENVKIHGAVNAHRLLEGNQAYGLGIYTQGSQAATEAAAKSGVYSKFAESEQLEGFKITNQRIDELFNGQEKIDLLKTNSDYIENCAIENQSEMYEVALNSKYSEVTDYVSAKIESSNNQVLDIVSNLNADYKAVTGNDIEVYDSAGTVSNIVAEFKAAMEQNDTQRQIQLLGKIPSNMLSSAISKISMYNVNLLATFVRLGRGNELLKIPGMSSDVTSKVIHLMLNSSLKDQKVAAKYVIDNKNYFSKTTLERCQELLHDNKNNTYTSAPMGGVKSALQPSMSAIYPGKKQMFYKA